jgi:hypothetical protein
MEFLRTVNRIIFRTIRPLSLAAQSYEHRGYSHAASLCANPRVKRLCTINLSGSLGSNKEEESAGTRRIHSTACSKDEYENADNAKAEVCYGWVCDKVKTGNCQCYNIRMRRKSTQKHLSEAEWRKRCAGCPVFPCLEHELAEVDCESWRSCRDWLVEEQKKET